MRNEKAPKKGKSSEMSPKETSPKKHKLDQLLSGNMERNEKRYAPPPAAAITAPDESAAVWIDVEKLHDNPYQPRRVIDPLELRDLMEGFDRVGQLQAAIATPHPTRSGHYTLLVGHRRKYAVLTGKANAGLHLPNPQQYIGKLRCEVRQGVTDFEMRFIATEENENRLEVNIIDRAKNYQGIRDDIEAGNAFLAGKPVTWVDIEQRLGYTYRRLRQILELLELPESIQKYFVEGKANPLYPLDPLNERHGRALLILKHDEKAMRSLLRQINTEKLSGTTAEKRANEMRRLMHPSKLDLDIKEADTKVHSEMQAEESARTQAENREALSQGTSHLSMIAGGAGSARGSEGSGFVQASAQTSSRSIVSGAVENAPGVPPARDFETASTTPDPLKQSQTSDAPEPESEAIVELLILAGQLMDKAAEAVKRGELKSLDHWNMSSFLRKIEDQALEMRKVLKLTP